MHPGLAKAEHEAASAEFKAAQVVRRRAQDQLEAAKAEHERRAEKFRELKAEANRAKDAFSHRLAELRAEQERRKDDKRSLAQQAGVPSQYWDDVWVSIDEDGNVNIYFGGLGEPVGDGHGHYAMDASGHVTYRRDPGLAHGAQNFTGYPAPSRPEGYYSRSRPDGSVERFIGPDGDITAERPHVHVIHSDTENRIIFVTTMSDGSHAKEEYLSADASGNDVDAMVDRLRRSLR